MTAAQQQALHWGVRKRSRGKGRRSGSASFLERIQPSEEPALYFHHSINPHLPCALPPLRAEYLQKLPVPGLGKLENGHGSGWNEDPWLLTQGWQRHLLQAQAVDKMVGDLLDRLQETGIYDEAILVVTSDHGGSFVNGEPLRHHEGEHRSYRPDPAVRQGARTVAGKIVDGPVQTIDILPTIAELLRAPCPGTTRRGGR